MNLDITYCSGKRCDVRDDCGRCTDRLSEWIKTIPKRNRHSVRYSVAEFSSSEGQKKPCKMYFKKESALQRLAKG